MQSRKETESSVIEGGCSQSAKRKSFFNSVDINHCIFLPRGKRSFYIIVNTKCTQFQTAHFLLQNKLLPARHIHRYCQFFHIVKIDYEKQHVGED